MDIMKVSFELEIFYRGSMAVQNVILTGDFDGWSCTRQMQKWTEYKGDRMFRLTIPIRIPRGTQKTVFKFIVDGQWTCSNEFAHEFDGNGNENNVLYYGDGIFCPQVKLVNPDEPEATPPKFETQEIIEKEEIVQIVEVNDAVKQPNASLDDSALNLDNPSSSSSFSSPSFPLPSPITVTCNDTLSFPADTPQEFPKKPKMGCSFGSIIKFLTRRCMRK